MMYVYSVLNTMKETERETKEIQLRYNEGERK